MSNGFLQVPQTSIPRVLATGGMNLDLRHVLAEEKPFDIFGKNATPDTAFALGGGAANFCTALNSLNQIFNTQARIKLMTHLGNAPQDNKTAIITAYGVSLLLKDTNIEVVDVVDGENIVPVNSVTEHADGRVISKHDVGHTGKFKIGIEEDIAREAAAANILFIDPRKPLIGSIAAKAAKEKGVPVFMDWGEKAWPEDKELEDYFNIMLECTDVIIVPSDAVVKGMTDHQVNPPRLFNLLRDEFGKENILMSDGNKPAHSLIDGVEGHIEVTPHEGRLFALAAGDTRNAGIVSSLLRGHDLATAFKHGTEIASIKVRHFNIEPDNGFAEEIRNHPELSRNITV